MSYDIGVDLDGCIIARGHLELPPHPSYRMVPHDAILIDGRVLTPSFAKRNAKTGFFEITPKPFSIWLPASIAGQIASALPYSVLGDSASSMRLEAEEGHIVVQRAPRLLTQGLTGWRLEISECNDGSCNIMLSALLHTEKADFLKRRVINYWPLVDGKAQRLNLQFTVDFLTRVACFGGYVESESKTEKPIPLAAHAHTSPLIAPDNSVFGYFGNGDVCKISIEDDQISWRANPCSNLQRLKNGLVSDGNPLLDRFPVITVCGIGKKVLGALLERSASFSIALTQGKIGSINTGSHEPDVAPPSIGLVSGGVNACLSAKGLELDFVLLSEVGHDEKIEHTIVIPWPILILRKFNCGRHFTVKLIEARPSE
jgi:hypothetical protein